MPDNFENLVLTGTIEIEGVGNNADNILTSNSSNNRLLGRGGNDTLIGGLGNDYLQGDLGSDTYVFSIGDGIDTIHNADANNNNSTDTVKFTNVASTNITAIYESTWGVSNSCLFIEYGAGDRVVVENFFSSSAISNRASAYKLT